MSLYNQNYIILFNKLIMRLFTSFIEYSTPVLLRLSCQNSCYREDIRTMCLFVVILLLLFTLIYWKLRSNRQYWTRKSVKQNNNGFVLGDNWSTVLGKQSFPEMFREAYNMFPNTRYSGFYMFLSPILVIKDPELIKQITVKDFDHFVNHKSIIPEGGDPIFNKILFFLKNQKWHDMRTTMSPAFTSSKMRNIFSLICQNGRQFQDYFLKKEEEIITVELKDIYTRFANDVIGNAAFGVEIDSLENPNNEFYLRGKRLTNFSGFAKTLKFFGTFLCPPLYRIFKISLFSQTEIEFFSDIIIDNIRSREKHGIVRPDIITMLLRTRQDEEYSSNHAKKSKMKISDQDIVSQEIAFFFGGFESVSSLLCFMSYELGVNPDIQKKLIEEVDKTSEACNGHITYEALLGMKYMDMVVSETLRKWPNVITTDRLCTIPYTIKPEHPDENAIHLDIDTHVWIPIFAIHRDPKYFPNPEKFDPERFSDENKDKIRPYTYLPFGAGPRSCLGSRLVLMETKILFFFLLSNFEIVPVVKTQIPLRVSRKDLNLTAEGGFWFGLKRRAK